MKFSYVKIQRKAQQNDTKNFYKMMNTRLEYIYYNIKIQKKDQLNIIYFLIFIYYQINSWIELNDDQKWIYQTYIPWGIVYILISIPIIIIQGPDYSNQSVQEKEIIQLFNDYNQLKQLNNEIPDFDQNYSIENIHPHDMKNNILFTLLIIQFFSDGFYSAITQLVALQYFSEIQRILLRFLARTCLCLDIIPEEFNAKVEAYFKIWSIKVIDELQYTARGAFYAILKKQKKISKEILQQDGNQIKLLFSEKFQSTYNLIKFAVTGSLTIFLAYSFQKSWSKSLIEDKAYFKIEVGPYALLSIFFFLTESIISDNCQIYIMNLRNLYYLKDKFGVPYIQMQKFHDCNLNTVAKIYAENNQYQFFYLVIQFWCIYYSKPTELILNFCSLNYIYNIDQIGIDRFLCNQNKIFYQKLFNHPWFQYPKQFKQKNFNLFYFYMLNMYNNWKPLLQKYQLKDEQIASVIKLEMNNLYNKLYFEDGYQLQFLEKSLSLKVRGLVLLLEILYCILMIYDKFSKWNDQMKEETYRGHLPWGISYVCVSIFMIMLQGIGRSEQNKTFKQYQYLMKNYNQLQQRRAQFEWDDNQVQRILCFNYFQEAILISFLLVQQYFLLSFYEILQNMLTFEFLFYLDEHALGTYFRYLYRFENIQKRWQNIPKIPSLENQSLEQIYRYVWNI